MKFKRLATILMAAAMMVSLVACTGDNGENSETPVTSGNDVVEETETNHITLAESWGFENFYTIMTPDVSASNFGITYYLSNFYDVLVEYAESETMVQTALSALLKGRTVIVIAHRMRTIANADKIVVLDKGKVTEVGTPSELAKKGGLYAHLVALQQKQQMSSLPT